MIEIKAAARLSAAFNTNRARDTIKELSGVSVDMPNLKTDEMIRFQISLGEFTSAVKALTARFGKPDVYNVATGTRSDWKYEDGRIGVIKRATNNYAIMLMTD